MNYIAYTIGPIYDTIFDTLNGDNKTKKLKAGSYFFSLFMKKLLSNIQDDFDVLVPYIGGEALLHEHKMGLFHDRFIAQSDKSKDEISAIFVAKVELTFKELARIIEDETKASELIHNMTNHSIIASQDELKNVDENVIFALNKILDSKELQRSFSFHMPKTNWIQIYQNNAVQKSKVKTIEDMSERLGFKYYAVITADGDKMGAKIKKDATQKPENIKELSKKLYNFFTQEDDIYTITNKQFGGELIYAGGDDILAFLPVKFEDKTFLDYIKVLDDRFKAVVGNDVSLSFGVNIAYYKYPLRNAINSAFDLLHVAKSNANIKNRLLAKLKKLKYSNAKVHLTLEDYQYQFNEFCKKSNRISLKITKHSGRYFGTTLALHNTRYEKYKKLVDGILNNEVSLPHSLHHSLKRYEEAILATYGYKNSSIKAMFATVFNDTKSDTDTKGLEIVREYLDICRPQTNDDFNALFSELSIIKFLRGDRE